MATSVQLVKILTPVFDSLTQFSYRKRCTTAITSGSRHGQRRSAQTRTRCTSADAASGIGTALVVPSDLGCVDITIHDPLLSYSNLAAGTLSDLVTLTFDRLTLSSGYTWLVMLNPSTEFEDLRPICSRLSLLVMSYDLRHWHSQFDTTFVPVHGHCTCTAASSNGAAKRT